MNNWIIEWGVKITTILLIIIVGAFIANIYDNKLPEKYKNKYTTYITLFVLFIICFFIFNISNGVLEIL